MRQEVPLTLADSEPEPDISVVKGQLSDFREYWIVLTSERQVEVYRRPENGRYREMRQIGADKTIECSSVPGIRLAVSELFR